MSDTKRGWHFVGDTLRDGRPIPPDGEWLVHDGPVVPCVSGLHMSEHPFDALQYARGSVLCEVELRGDLQPHGRPIDKWAGRERRILKRIDATTLFLRFAADQALSVAHLWDMPAAVREYLQTLDESKREEAWIAAGEAARAASVVSARAAALAASWSAWRFTDGSTAGDIAWAAAEEAAFASARDVARDEFLKRVYEALRCSY